MWDNDEVPDASTEVSTTAAESSHIAADPVEASPTHTQSDVHFVTDTAAATVSDAPATINVDEAPTQHSEPVVSADAEAGAADATGSDENAAESSHVDEHRAEASPEAQADK